MMPVLLLDSPIPNPPASTATSLSHSGLVRQNGLSIDTTPAGRKLQKAAAEFESILLSSLWKSMKSSFASEDDDSSDPAHDALADMGIQAMSSAVAKTGGLGLGKLILKHLEPMLVQRQAQSPTDSGKGSAPSADIP